ncbi:hypothetical protein FACS189427_12030 [Planctomycetales bacterium]|nr:hypothetical protein FACS189427_12030 [Planctomycetales bacterium]
MHPIRWYLLHALLTKKKNLTVLARHNALDLTEGEIWQEEKP